MENSLYRGERILVNKWSYGLRLPFISLWGYHRWGDKPVRKDDILVFNNPANLSQTAIDQREVYIGRCLGVPGDTLWVDSLFSVIPSEKNAPDQKFLYTYPRKKEKQLDSLLTILLSAPTYYWDRIQQKRTQLQQVRVLSVGTGFRNKQLDRACR